MTLITGGAGFIGSHLVRLLVERGEQVRVLERPGAKVDHLPLAQIELAWADIRDRRAVDAAMVGCDHVYHLAANPQLWTQRKGDFRQVNYIGTINVLSAALKAGASRILHCSTESILTRAKQNTAIAENQDVPLGEVIGPYCRSKWYAERFAFRLARHGAPLIIVSPTLPIGPGDWGRSPPTQMILDCALGRRSFYLDAELNLIDVRDAAAGMIAAMERGHPGRRYLLGAENWTIRKLFDWVASRCGVPGPRFAVPYPIALTTAMISEWFAEVATHSSPAATTTGVRLTRRTMRFDAARSMSELGITPRPVTESLLDALAWYRALRWLR